MSAIFVGNLPWTTTSEDLQAKYGPFNCQSAEVVIGKNGGSTSVGTVISAYSRTHCSTGNHIADAQVSTIVNLDVGDVVRFYVTSNLAHPPLSLSIMPLTPPLPLPLCE